MIGASTNLVSGLAFELEATCKSIALDSCGYHSMLVLRIVGKGIG